MLACWGREAMMLSHIPYVWLSLWPCFHGCPAFLHRHFPPQSPPSHPLDRSLCSQQQPSHGDYSTIPKLQLLATVPSWVCMVTARTVWFSFHLGCHRSAASHSALNVSPLTQTFAPCGDQTPSSVPPPAWGRSSPTNIPVYLPSSFVLPSFVWVYIFFSWRRQWHPTPVLLPGKSHGRRSLEGCSLWGHWGLDTTEQLHFHFSLSCIGEGNGNPLQCSCLENPRDGRAWWAAVYGVTQSWTRLKWLRTRLKWLSSGSSIYSFPLVRYSCLLSTGVLHALLCLKGYSWCICGERCTLCPPTPLPSCSPNINFWWLLDYITEWGKKLQNCNGKVDNFIQINRNYLHGTEWTEKYDL